MGLGSPALFLGIELFTLLLGSPDVDDHISPLLFCATKTDFSEPLLGLQCLHLPDVL